MKTYCSWCWAMALGLMLPVLASAETFIQDGAGNWWDFGTDGGVVDGRGPAAAPDSVDAFDNAARIVVNGTPFPASAQATAMSGQMMVTGPATMSGLAVTRRAYVPSDAGANWCCFLEYFENPTGAPISVSLRLVGNLGSDGDTVITGSSDGDTSWTPADRWISTDDNHNGTGDPSLSFNWCGANAALSPQLVNMPASQEDYYCDFPLFSVPAGDTVIIMYFLSQNANDDGARATAAALDALPAAALAGLNAFSYGPVLNWAIATTMTVTPSSLRAFSGMQGGSFSPASYDYTVTNTGTASISWSASGPSWLTLSSAGGTLAAGANTTVTATINAGANSLAPGPTAGTITFTNATNSEDVLRAARVDVSERLAITEADGFTASGFQGGPFTPANRTYTLTNAGDTALQWSTTPPAWLTVTPADSTAAGGALAPAASVTITVAPNAAAQALAPGAHSGTLTITNTSYSSTLIRAMALTVVERLRIDNTQGSPAIVYGLPGGPFSPAGLSYRLVNTSPDAAVNWQVSLASIPAWLDIPATSGTAPANSSSACLMSLNAAALPVGDYTATLVFQNTSYGSSLSQDVVLRIKNRVYVDAAAAAGGNGLTWGTAYDTIQEGIDLAATGDYAVWVAKGTYNEHITLAQGVDVFGGFVNGDTAFVDREVLDNATIIDGGGTARVVTFGAIGLAGISGFTIQNGLGDANGGGGIRMDGSLNTCSVDSCIIRNNRSAYRGAGIYCLNNAAPQFKYLFVFGNIQANDNRDFGGGIACLQSNPWIYCCTIANNVGRYGGGIGLIQSSPTIDGCTIVGNMAAYDVINSGSGQPEGSGGGAIFAHNQSSPRIVNCLIAGNVARNWHAGALFCQGQSKPVLINCTITKNHAFNTSNGINYGGFAANTGSVISLYNSLVEGHANLAAREEDPWPNTAANLAQIVPAYCLFANNPQGDVYDYDTHTAYTGGDNLNANLTGAHNNVAGGPNPQYMSVLSGQWSAAPVFSAAAYTTTLTVAGTPFLGLDLSGYLLNADIAQWRQAPVFSNTDNTITVWGDITSATGVYGMADAGDTFSVYNPHLKTISPCINTGTNDTAIAPYFDIEMILRGTTICIGAFENNAPAVAQVVSITPTEGAVSNEGAITFEVLFSRAVTNLTASDFMLTVNGGQTGASVSGVTGSDYRWIVTITPGPGNGQIILDFLDLNSSVIDELGQSGIPTTTTGGATYVDFLKFTEQPQGASVEVGEDHTFHVTAQDGTGPLHYLWLRNGADAGGPDAADFALTDLVEAQSGTYTCEVSDNYTTITSDDAVLEVGSHMPVMGGAGFALLAFATALTGAGTIRRRK